jgi:hypothetical protein
VYVEVQVAATSPGWRNDLGIYLRTDAPLSLGGAVTAANVGLSGTCVQSILPPALGNSDGDACGDLNGTATCVVRVPLNVTCTDLVGQGDVTIPVCLTWNTGSPSGVCSTTGLLPTPASKCACYVHTLSGFSVAGGSPKGVLYAPANSVFPEDQSVGGPAPPAPPMVGAPPAPPWCGGKPAFNWGTSSYGQGSCPGDVWNTWGGQPTKTVQCVSQDLDVVRTPCCSFAALQLHTCCHHRLR